MERTLLDSLSFRITLYRKSLQLYLYVCVSLIIVQKRVYRCSQFPFGYQSILSLFVCFYLKYSQIMSKTQVVFNPSTKIWSGPSVTYPYGNKSVGEVIYETLLSDLDHVSQVTIVSNQCYCPHFKITHF